MLRSMLFNVVFWPSCALYLIILYPFIICSSSNTVYKFGYRTIANLLMFCLKIFSKIDYQIENLELLQRELQKGPVIIGCNHQSTWETFIFAKLFGDLSMVIKKELLDIPVAGLYFKKLNCIPIDRSSPVKAIKDLMKYGKKSIDSGLSILIFPNGTRSSSEDYTEFKSGIYSLYKYLGIPVISAHVDSGKYWPRRSFKKYPGTIHISFVGVIQPGLLKDDFIKKFKSFANS